MLQGATQALRNQKSFAKNMGGRFTTVSNNKAIMCRVETMTSIYVMIILKRAITLNEFNALQDKANFDKPNCGKLHSSWFYNLVWDKE